MEGKMHFLMWFVITLWTSPTKPRPPLPNSPSKLHLTMVHNDLTTQKNWLSVSTVYPVDAPLVT